MKYDQRKVFINVLHITAKPNAKTMPAKQSMVCLIGAVLGICIIKKAKKIIHIVCAEKNPSKQASIITLPILTTCLKATL